MLNEIKEWSPYRIYYKGIRVAQRLDVIEALSQLNNICKPSTIIEIGTANGGFTKILEDHPISLNAEIYTYDIRHKQYNFNRAKFIQKDCFKVEKEIAKQIQKEGITILFCDGGNKIKEFNTFAKYLKTGDIILAHDYIEDETTFNNYFKNKLWNWHETSLAPILNTIKEEGLKDILPEYFSKAVWKSCIKE
jgi:cephalosporin hydroxylase